MNVEEVENYERDEEMDSTTNLISGVEGNQSTKENKSEEAEAAPPLRAPDLLAALEIVDKDAHAVAGSMTSLLSSLRLALSQENLTRGSWNGSMGIELTSGFAIKCNITIFLSDLAHRLQLSLKHNLHSRKCLSNGVYVREMASIWSKSISHILAISGTHDICLLQLSAWNMVYPPLKEAKLTHFLAIILLKDMEKQVVREARATKN
eukprot:Gb_21419 [translate_table: standard]